MQMNRVAPVRIQGRSMYSLILIVPFFVEASTSKGVTNGSSQTEEYKHCPKGLEENPKDVNVIWKGTQCSLNRDR